MSAAMASWAARLISAGAGKSGKPCERLMALYWSASRVISRMTDSVNWPALAEILTVAASARCGLGGFILHPVNLTIDFRVARDDFNVLASLGERNRIHKFRDFAVRLAGVPLADAVFPSIVRGQRRFQVAHCFAQARKIDRAKVDVIVGVEKLCARVAYFCLLGHQARCLRQKLHQSHRVGGRARLGLECGFLADQASCDHGVNARVGRPLTDGSLKRERIRGLPRLARNILERARFELWVKLADRRKRSATVAGVDSCLRCFEQQARFTGCGVACAQL